MLGLYLLIGSLLINLFIFFIGKKSNIFATIQIIILWFISVFSYDVTDYANYLSYYHKVQNGIDTSSIEVGYKFINLVLSCLGFDFQIARGIIITFSMLLFIFAFKKIGGSPNFVSTCFTLYPLFIDIIQLRTLLATAVLTIGIVYFLNEKKYITYIIYVLIASSIHISFGLYLIFILNEKFLLKKRQKNVAMTTGALGCLVFFLANRQLPFLNIILSLLGKQEKYSMWLTLSGKLGFLIFVTLVLLSIIIMKKISENTVYKREYVNLVYRLNIISIWFIPFTMLASTFGRLISNLCLINYLAWQAQYFDMMDAGVKRGKIPKYRLTVYLCIVMYIFIWIWFEIIPEFDTRIMPFFQNNYIFGVNR